MQEKGVGDLCFHIKKVDQKVSYTHPKKGNNIKANINENLF